MKKNIFIFSIFLLLFFLIFPFKTHGHMMDSNEDRATSNEKICNQSDSYYKTQGDKFMEKMMGKEQNKILEQKIGKELSKDMDIHMGKTLAGCENNQFMTKMFKLMPFGKEITPNSMFSNNFGMGMNTWGFGFMGLFIGSIIILILAFLILGIIYFWKGIKKQKK